MAINTQFPAWMLPTETPMEALFKGVQAGSMIKQNSLRQQAMLIDAHQHQQDLDLKERELIAHNESRDLENTIKRTKLVNDAEDYRSGRDWVEKFGNLSGDALAAAPPPVMHDHDNAIGFQASVNSKWAKSKELEVGRIHQQIAAKMSTNNNMLHDKGVQAEVLALAAQSPMMTANLDTLQKAFLNAEKLEATRASAEAIGNYKRDVLAETAHRNDLYERGLDIREDSAEDRNTIAQKRLELDSLLRQPDLAYKDARVELIRAQIHALQTKPAQPPRETAAEKETVKRLGTELEGLLKKRNSAMNNLTLISPKDKMYKQLQDSVVDFEKRIAGVKKNLSDLTTRTPAQPQGSYNFPVPPSAAPGTNAGPSLKYNPATGQFE